jgi:hypothetical protein
MQNVMILASSQRLTNEQMALLKAAVAQRSNGMSAFGHSRDAFALLRAPRSDLLSSMSTAQTQQQQFQQQQQQQMAQAQAQQLAQQQAAQAAQVGSAMNGRGSARRG